MSTEKPSPLDLEFAALMPPPEPGPDCIAIGLTFAQMNALLAVLGAAPYAQVAELIESIRLQAADQWNREAQAQALAAAPVDADAPN